MVKSIVKFNKFLKNRDFWLVAVILVFGFYTGFFQNLFKPSESNKNLARLEIDFGTSRRAFEGEINSGMSILDALLAASRGGDFEVRYALLNDQTEVMKLDGIIEYGLGEKGFSFYLNGGLVEESEIHKIKIKPGDKILVRFE